MTCIITAIKISMRFLQSTCTRSINECLYVNIRNIRNPLIFNTSHVNLTRRSPIHSGITFINEYRNLFNMDDMSPRIKKAIRGHFITLNNS